MSEIDDNNIHETDDGDGAEESLDELGLQLGETGDEASGSQENDASDDPVCII